MSRLKGTWTIFTKSGRRVDENEQVDEDYDGDDEEDDEFEIEFKQWTTTDRTELVHNALPADEFIEELCEKLDKITSHSYIAKSQAKYLADLKDNLKENEAIVLGDFAENYQFLIQDEVQGYHWSKKYCSLHPIVIYYKSGTELIEKSLCVISEDIDHDVSFLFKDRACSVHTTHSLLFWWMCRAV